MPKYSYQIIVPVSFDYTDDFWRKFAAFSPSEPVLTLKYKERSADPYDIEAYPDFGNRKVYCVSHSILAINDDFTDGTIFSQKKDHIGIYSCAMVALYGNLIR